jgi:cystathionine beta-lyase family protein involved in aluminum resistance
LIRELFISYSIVVSNLSAALLPGNLSTSLTASIPKKKSKRKKLLKSISKNSRTKILMKVRSIQSNTEK